MKRLILLVAAVLAVAGTQYVTELVPAARIKIVGMSPRDLATRQWTTQPSTGLDVVGKGQIVYLQGSNGGTEAVTYFEWAITGPDGGAVAPDTQGQEWTTFRPMNVGAYTVTLTIQTTAGNATTSIQVKAGEYVGVGSIGGQNPNFRTGQCAGCHADQAIAWEGTQHATALNGKLDGLESANFAEYCLSCHVLGYDKSPSAVNGGFDDVQRELGWAFPSHPAPGDWQNMVTNFPALAAKTQIQCESCHGPGSEHKGNTAMTDISVDVKVCSQCHDSGTYHVYPLQWANSGHAMGTSFAYAGARTGCADCHSTWGFIAKIDPLSNLDQKVGKGEGVTCAACHDPHKAGNPNQLRTVADVTLIDGTVITWGGKGRLCMNCHRARRTGAIQVETGGTRQDPHRSNQVDMLAANKVANTFGYYIPSSTHRNALPETCVSCHMYETPTTYEAGRDALGSHSFRVKNLVNGAEADNVEACVRCHGEIEEFTDIKARVDYDGDKAIESAKAELQGLMDQVAMLLPPIGVPTFTVTNSYTRLQKMAAFNYNFIHEDGSEGMHNFQYAIGLAQLTLKALAGGVLAPGAIATVLDVPNDQGRQVQVVWQKFGGDGVAEDPVLNYYIWRKDNIAGKGTLSTLDKVEGEAVGMAIDLAGEVWTAVGQQPAARLETYSAIVPTLGDGAATEFMVTGHTRAGLVAMSNPLAGTSTDNLAPRAPSGMVVDATASSVKLTWDEPADADFKFFSVYRGTTSGFTPATPLATTTEPTYVDNSVAAGNYYFYVVTATDFAGNQGVGSAEATASVSVANESTGLPTEFALNQNYPNPFNPTTTISFDVPATSEITITVYDILGRQVETLVNESMAAGRHTVQMDGSSLTSGLYIVRMRTGNRVFERSIVLMK